jgi:hypothetical protein
MKTKKIEGIIMKSNPINRWRFTTWLTFSLLSFLPAWAQTQLIQNGGFDSGTSPWQLSGAATISGYGSLYHSSPDYLWLGGDTGTDGAYQTITIPSTISAANLSFYYNINSVSGRSKPAMKGRFKTSHFEGSIASWAAWAAPVRNERTQCEPAAFDINFGGQWLVQPADCA